MKSIQQILKADPALKSEVTAIIGAGDNLPAAKKAGVSRNAIKKAVIGPHAELPLAEAIIRIHLRPALLIKNNKIAPPDSLEIRKRFLPYVPMLESRVPSIGRIDFRKLGKKFGGTGWMITDDIIVTNRHVAQVFAERRSNALVFRKNALGETIEVLIDYREEHMGVNQPNAQFEVPVEKVIYMANDNKQTPDIAFLKIKKNNPLPGPIPIQDKILKPGQQVSVIGYPAFDEEGIITPAVAAQIFGGIYEVKRCSPGEVMEDVNNSWYFFHDCTTLGGSSGSPVLDNQSGAAIGLHFLGDAAKENYAVKASQIIKHLQKVSSKVFISKPTPTNGTALTTSTVEEASPEDYLDRTGFDEEFLGKRYKIPLPTITKNKRDILKVEIGGKKTSIIKYTHFSLVMNQKRRLCVYSAANIDGSTSKRGIARSGWKYDPRIPKKFQVKDECYGDPPKFSRGHMTRKEDPIWGDLPIARLASRDTFHVTNATPQIQSFNSPVWLELEDYALENARQDIMKISVITGPIFDVNDREIDGVKVPLEYFKVIAFVHDHTKKLTATGYTVSQAPYLSNLEFVFGPLNTYQTSIRIIERRTGLQFGNLSKIDPVRGEEGIVSPLASTKDIRFF